MHSQIGSAFFQRDFEFFDKQTFATDFAQRAIEDLIALGGHAQDVHRVTHGPQQVLHMVGLPQSQAAFAGGDGEVNRAQKESFSDGLWSREC
jgi:hypothetical protein